MNLHLIQFLSWIKITPRLLLILLAQLWPFALMRKCSGEKGLLLGISSSWPPSSTIPRVWSVETWYNPPETFQEAVYIFTSLREFNQLVRMGLSFCLLPEAFYPIRYYGAYGEHEQKGYIMFEKMDDTTGYCVTLQGTTGGE